MKEKKLIFVIYLCEDGFLNKHQYETHFESNHNGMKPYKCIKCDHIFTDKIESKRQVGSVHDGSKHFCTYCNSNFSKMDYLNKHIATIHEGKKTHLCYICKENLK